MSSDGSAVEELAARKELNKIKARDTLGKVLSFGGKMIPKGVRDPNKMIQHPEYYMPSNKVKKQPVTRKLRLF